MRVLVYDEAAMFLRLSYARRMPVSLCPGRLEKARVVEAFQRRRSSSGRPGTEPRGPQLRQHVFEGDRGE